MTVKRKHRGGGDSILRKRILSAISATEIKTGHNVMENLLSKHGEYNRKNKQALLSTINDVLSEYGGNALNRTMSGSYKAPTENSQSKNPKEKDALNESSEKTKQPGKTTKKRKRVVKKTLESASPNVRYSDMGGMESIIQTVREVCEYPLLHTNVYNHLGVKSPCGVLLHGPPGCGKTMLAQAIAGELQVPFYSLSAPEIVSGMSGESEQKIRDLFEEALENSPSIIFIDEIDAITGKRDSSARGMERRIVAQLLTCMDSLSAVEEPSADDTDDTKAKENESQDKDGLPEKKDSNGSEVKTKGGVIVIGATNRPDSLDAALRRAGRFDREIPLGIPDKGARVSILSALAKRMRLSGDFDFEEIAKKTPGFVGADLAAVCKEAAVIAVNRIFSIRMENDSKPTEIDSQRTPFSEKELESIFIDMHDFRKAIGKVQPSAKREGFATVPSVTWDDVGALSKVREELRMAISEPVTNPERFQAMGLTVPAGVLLYGPPGCGKTLVAKAVANSSGANFISVKGPELLNKFVGESERAVRQVFARARASSPCVVFFDELDSLAPKRSSGGESGGVTERVVNQLLTEMDGLEERRNVFVIAATNRPDIIDPAMLRPGRLDKLLFVPLPSSEDRCSILKTAVRKTPLEDDVDLDQIAMDTRLEGFSGADLTALVRDAAVSALSANLSKVGKQQFEQALGKTKASVRNQLDYKPLENVPKK